MPTTIFVVGQLYVYVCQNIYNVIGEQLHETTDHMAYLLVQCLIITFCIYCLFFLAVFLSYMAWNCHDPNLPDPLHENLFLQIFSVIRPDSHRQINLSQAT